MIQEGITSTKACMRSKRSMQAVKTKTCANAWLEKVRKKGLVEFWALMESRLNSTIAVVKMSIKPYSLRRKKPKLKSQPATASEDGWGGW